MFHFKSYTSVWKGGPPAHQHSPLCQRSLQLAVKALHLALEWATGPPKVRISALLCRDMISRKFVMPAASTPTLPPRRSLVVWAILAVVMVIGSYVLILLLAAACVYLPYLALLSFESPGLQVLALFFCGIAMAGTMLWSLVPRRDKFQPPGPLLEPSSHPRLFAELETLAALLREPLPREVYLIPDVNAWVTDRGGIMGFGSRRVMGLGLPLLSVLTISQFRAVLAHEFAHYYGGDTRLGPWVYKTRMAMVRTVENMASIGKVIRIALAQIVYAIVMWLLGSYWKLFFRATQLVSRRQEYRADELACHIAGSQALIEGLQKIHGAEIAMPSFWNTEVGPLLEEGYRPPIADGFARFVAAPNVSKAIQDFLAQQLQESKTDPYDSHPPLADRIAAAKLLPARSEQQDEQLAKTLFDHLQDEEVRLLQTMNPSFKPGDTKLVGWEEAATAVWPPLWRKHVAQYSSLLTEITVETLPQAIMELPQMGERIPDPPGMLLTPEQRTARAADLLTMALALALIDRGWKLNADPGELYLHRDGQQLAHTQVIAGLRTGELSGESWVGRCHALGLSGLHLCAPGTIAATD